MNRIRDIIQTALDELALTPREVSLAIGQDPGYLDDFLGDGNRRGLSLDDCRKLSIHLGIPLAALRPPKNFRYPADHEASDPVLASYAQEA